MNKRFIDRVYETENPDRMTSIYNDWAAEYDNELAASGYATPGRIARALKEHLPDMQAPVLDYGCGTGLSGIALKEEGFQVIDGMDPSAGMLEQAARKGLYRNLIQLDLADESPIEQGRYKAIAAVGVIGAGAAPVEVFNTLMHALDTGGLLTFSFNDHTLANNKNLGIMNDWLDCGAGRLLHRKYGAHLPSENVKSYVYVIEKA